MKRALLAAALAAAACGKQTFLAAAFVQTPALPNPQDAQHPFPQYQIVTAYFGTIDTTDPTSIDSSKLGTIDDAQVDVSFDHVNPDGSLAPRDLYPAGTPAAANHWQESNGTYTLNSNDEPNLTFEMGQPYRLVLLTSDGDAYGAEFVPGATDDMQEFQSPTCSGFGVTVPRCIETFAHGTDLLITRTVTPPSGQEREPAFLVVGMLDPQNPTALPTITYTSVPQTAFDLLEYELSDEPYRWATKTIPGATAFPSAGLYAVALVTVEEGKVSGNAFLGSTALAGSGAAGLINVQ